MKVDEKLKQYFSEKALKVEAYVFKGNVTMASTDIIEVIVEELEQAEQEEVLGKLLQLNGSTEDIHQYLKSVALSFFIDLA
ncbi:hypothetical protein [Paenibacillus sinopodophylli]|uniref:hypothetical protein n=1 Tax=Paenibacillus sinopodophylli TaxID=1837342 RepID=UPI00110CE382|nr:hypothetical protein [Paenibacillus sinopodophylli]